MILDTLANAEKYYNLHHSFKKAFEYITKQKDPHEISEHVEVDGSRVFILPVEADGEGHEGAEIEAHKKYIDIQVGLEGVNEFGWKPTSELQTVTKPFDDADDYGFWGDKPYVWIPVHPGQFAIFFPEDGHTPKGGRGHLKKIIIKVAV